jgi:hypothetical protein
MKLMADEQELLLPEITLLAKTLPDPAARQRYEDLRTAVVEGEVGDELISHLTNVLEVGLQSGRLRHLYGPEGEKTLTRLFGRTPAGAAVTEGVRAVTEALSALQNQVIQEIHLSALGPGSYSVTIDTDRCQVTLRLDRQGARIESVAVGV